VTVPLERATHLPVSHARDGQSQAVPVSQEPQKPRPRHARRLPPNHLVQPTTPQHSGHPRRPAREQLRVSSPLCGPHLRGLTTARCADCISKF
jgi:hypothetical protein